MSATYRWVQWNAHKKSYDLLVAVGVVLFLSVWVVLGVMLYPPPNEIAFPVLLMRGLGVCALVLLHVILAIGPLARLSVGFAPLLYNRRHLGVVFFFVSFLHAFIAIGFYGGFGVENPLAAVVAGYESWGSVEGFPFEVLGFLGLMVFFVMAATSHDYWLKNLGPGLWKGLHMLVYPAYALIVAHTVLGALRTEFAGFVGVLLAISAAGLVGLHLTVGVREFARDRRGPRAGEGWVDVGTIDEIGDGRAKVVCLGGAERVAVFRDGDSVSAVSNVCAHQGGPLGEGRIVDGCITCPWHGYQYRPGDGQSPPPYEERIPTYEVRLEGRRVLLNPRANAPGTAVAPARLVEGTGDAGS